MCSTDESNLARKAEIINEKEDLWKAMMTPKFAQAMEEMSKDPTVKFNPRCLPIHKKISTKFRTQATLKKYANDKDILPTLQAIIESWTKKPLSQIGQEFSILGKDVQNTSISQLNFVKKQ